MTPGPNPEPPARAALANDVPPVARPPAFTAMNPPPLGPRGSRSRDLALQQGPSESKGAAAALPRLAAS